MFCKSCGSQINEGATACPGCGVSVTTSNNPSMEAATPLNASANAAQPQYHQTQYQQPQYQQPQYHQPQYQSPADIRATLANSNTTSVVGWIGWFLLCGFLPLIGMIIALCVSKDQSVKNAMIAQLVMGVIGVVLVIILTAVVGLSLNEIVSSSRY